MRKPSVNKNERIPRTSPPQAKANPTSAPLKPQLLLPILRSLTTSPLLLKKKSRAEREAEESSSKTSAPDFEDPYDFSILNNALERNLEKLKNDLAKLRMGGRFNPETLEDLRVSLDKESKKTERLGDLAQVFPKGRQLQVLVGEKDVSSCLCARNGQIVTS